VGINKADPPSINSNRPTEEIGRLWQGLQEVRRGEGRLYLLLGGSDEYRIQLLEALASDARAQKIDVLGCSARDQSGNVECLGINLIRDDLPLRTELSNGSADTVDACSRPLPLRSARAPVQAASLDWVSGLCSALKQAARRVAVVVILQDFQTADDDSINSIAQSVKEGLASGLMIVAAFPDPSVARGTKPCLQAFAGLGVSIRLEDMDEDARTRSFGPPSCHRFESREDFDLPAIGIASAGGSGSISPHGLTAPSSQHIKDGRRNEESKYSHGMFSQNRTVNQTAAHRVEIENPGRRQLRAIPSPKHSARSRTDEARDRCGLLIDLGEQLSRNGESKSAEKALCEAASLAERLEDSALLTRIVLALPAWHWPGPGEANPLAALLAQRALVIEREDENRRAILMARLAAELSYSPDSRKESARLAADAMRHVAGGTNSNCELYVRLYRDQMLRQPDRLIERLENAESISRLAIESGDYGACCAAVLAKIGSLLPLGEIAAAEHAAEFAVGIMPASQIRFHHGLAAACAASRAVMDGRFADAFEDFDRCRALAEDGKLSNLLDASWPAMLLPYAEEGRLEELEIIAEETFRRRRSTAVYAALLSGIKAQLERPADASFLLERLAQDDFANLSASTEGIAGMAALANVCHHLDRADYAAILYKRLLPWGKLNATLNAVVMFGSTERYLGILASVLGRLDEAIGHFEASLRLDRRGGARPWAVYSSLGLATALARRGRAEDRARARELVSELEVEASLLKMKRALSRLSSVLDLLGGGNISAAKNGVSKTSSVIKSEPSNANPPKTESGLNQSRLEAEPTPSDAVENSSKPEDSPNRERTAFFLRNGEYWQIGYNGHTSTLRHRRGLELIFLLVRHPGRELFALELANEGRLNPPAFSGEDAPIADSGAPVLDAEAKRSYRQRLTEIREELEKFRDANDIARIAKLEEEQDFLTRELASAIGLFGRDRVFNSEAERARKRVSIAITRAIHSISDHNPQFALYLERSIRTGNLCCYTPDPSNPINWKL
jgi:hypothetical protein